CASSSGQLEVECGFADSISSLLAAASRGELENAHAVLVEMAERELFSQAIKLAHGNQAKAARWLGISRLTLREKLTRLGLHPNATQMNTTAAEHKRDGRSGS